MAKVKGTTINVHGVYSAPVKQDDADAYLAGTNRYLCALASASKETANNEFEGWYNGEKQESIISEGNTVVNSSGKNISGEDIGIMLGKKYDPAQDIIFDDGSQAEAPYMTCSYCEITVDGAILRQFHKGKWMVGNKEAATKTGGGYDAKTITLVYNALSTVYQYDLSSTDYKKFDVASESWVALPAGTMIPLMELEKRVTKAEFAAAKTAWYASVQLPGTSSASALVLSSSSPTDGDTGVAVAVEPTLTFNNPISKESITLLDGTTNIDITTEKNTTNKIITTEPDSSLDTATEFSLVYDVTDVYGQRLQGAITFTTE